MQPIRGTAFLTAVVCVLAVPARADLNDGKPCFSWINPPGAGIRYVCTSSSRHTVEHPNAEPHAGPAWRTRISARREGEPVIYDVTIDSLSPPSDDPAAKAALATANAFVAGAGFAVDPPAVLSSSTTHVEGQSLAPVVQTTTVTPFVLSSSNAARVLCVGNVGDLAEPPLLLPEAPCGTGATALALRPLDTSASTPLADRLEDTHTHVRTDSYAALRLTGDLTTSHLEVVAHAALPCASTRRVSTGWFLVFGTVYECTSSSHHTITHDSPRPIASDAWSTRVTGRFRGSPPLFDTTINATVKPEQDDSVRQAILDASRAIAAAAGPEVALTGPRIVSSSSQDVTAANLSGAAVVSFFSSVFQTSSLTRLPSATCVGDFGDLDPRPYRLPPPPCPAGSWKVNLIPSDVTIGSVSGDILSSIHTHVQRDVYPGLTVTGTLTTTHYEVVAEAATTTLTVPIVLSPSGGSAFTSELTLANSGTSDASLTFDYVPAFGGTPGSVTDTLPAGRERILPDAIAYLKGLGLSDPGAGGTLRITFGGLSSSSDSYAAVRTTAAVPGGRVGLSYAALPASRLRTAPVFLCGLRQNSLDRSNVAVLNAGAAGDGPVTLRLTVISGDPGNPQSKTLPDVTLPPGGFSQISSVLASNGLSLSNGIVRVERLSGTAPFYAYAVVNDMATADGSFVEPVATDSAAPISSTTLPVVVETPTYSTELVLTNLSASPRTLNFTWVAPALAGGRASFSNQLLPNEQQILPAFVQLLRDRGAVTDPRGPSFAGALFASDSSGDLRGVSISARILSALEGGRAGVFLPSFPADSEATSSVRLCGLQQNPETRTNLALVNTGSVDSSPSTFQVDLFDGATAAKAGSLVSTVPAKGFVQIDRILATYAPAVTQGCALVTKTSGSNPFLAYAVLNDGAQPGQRSGDGAFVAPAP